MTRSVIKSICKRKSMNEIKHAFNVLDIRDCTYSDWTVCAAIQKIYEIASIVITWRLLPSPCPSLIPSPLSLSHHVYRFAYIHLCHANSQTIYSICTMIVVGSPLRWVASTLGFLRLPLVFWRCWFFSVCGRIHYGYSLRSPPFQKKKNGTHTTFERKNSIAFPSSNILFFIRP